MVRSGRSVSLRRIVRFPVATLLFLVMMLYPYRMDSLTDVFWTEYDTRVMAALFLWAAWRLEVLRVGQEKPAEFETG